MRVCTGTYQGMKGRRELRQRGVHPRDVLVDGLVGGCWWERLLRVELLLHVLDRLLRADPPLLVADALVLLDERT